MTTEAETTVPDIAPLSIRLTTAQMDALNNLRLARGWTKTRLVEMALREYFEARGATFPESEKRIA